MDVTPASNDSKNRTDHIITVWWKIEQVHIIRMILDQDLHPNRLTLFVDRQTTAFQVLKPSRDSRSIAAAQ